MGRLEFIQLVLTTILFSAICSMKRVDYLLSKHLFFSFLFILTSGLIIQIFMSSRNKNA